MFARLDIDSHYTKIFPISCVDSVMQTPFDQVRRQCEI